MELELDTAKVLEQFAYYKRLTVTARPSNNQESRIKNQKQSSTTAMATLAGARDGAGGCQPQHNDLKFKVHVSNPKLQSRHNNKSNS